MLEGTCIPAGLAPEFVRFSGVMYAGAEHNLLRPETVEALFVLWRTTGDAKYREWGWEIFEAFEKHCRVRRDVVRSLVHEPIRTKQSDLSDAAAHKRSSLVASKGLCVQKRPCCRKPSCGAACTGKV